MKQYLLDTNIVIFLFKNQFEIDKKIDEIGFSNCLISEITVLELKYGALKSNRPEFHLQKLNRFLRQIEVLPVFSAIDLYASERVRLEKLGNRIDDFDLLIGTTAVSNDLIAVTNNVSHLGRIEGIQIEDWTK